jgi:2-amino-4-hydroxy-6-hydroxymethyldihydropteridine diphosphokinase
LAEQQGKSEHRRPEVAYIALGTNVGNRDAHLRMARAALCTLPNSRVLAESAVEETPPVGPIVQGNYLNQMIALETTLDPDTLHSHLMRIEREQGRVRGERWGPRTLDLDIVLFGDRRIDTPRLTIPHREIPNRDFWQRELIELRGDWR